MFTNVVEEGKTYWFKNVTVRKNVVGRNLCQYGSDRVEYNGSITGCLSLK